MDKVRADFLQEVFAALEDVSIPVDKVRASIMRIRSILISFLGFQSPWIRFAPLEDVCRAIVAKSFNPRG